MNAIRKISLAKHNLKLMSYELDSHLSHSMPCNLQVKSIFNQKPHDQIMSLPLPLVTHAPG